ncbi:HypC/HybG/HupF family hydrogenase formation chaperone [Streptomyces sp. NPDC006463]|uniref:HypC/HybG/HupF family hydrogenase formation chaperone n=1 Tax=Streptomyces sp. NPDC006463 TaxID=3364746 RepID=UPI0036BC1303
MCLAVPGRVLDIGERDGTRMATVDFGGVQKEVCLEYLPDLQVGEYAIVHVGFALQRLDEESAKQTLELFAQLGMLQEEFGDPWEAAAAAGGAPWPFADEPDGLDVPAGAAPHGEVRQEEIRK